MTQHVDDHPWIHWACNWLPKPFNVGLTPDLSHPEEYEMHKPEDNLKRLQQEMLETMRGFKRMMQDHETLIRKMDARAQEMQAFCGSERAWMNEMQRLMHGIGSEEQSESS